MSEVFKINNVTLSVFLYLVIPLTLSFAANKLQLFFWVKGMLHICKEGCTSLKNCIPSKHSFLGI